MFLADISIKRPIMMTMVIMAFVVLGFFSYSRLGIDLMPKMDFPFISVITVYPGAGPEEIETLINKPLEEEISGISGLKNLFSIAQEGVSIIFAELQLGQNVDIGAIDIKDKIDAIRRNLPTDMEDPVVQKFQMGSMPIISLSVTGPYSLYQLNDIVEKTIKPEMGKISGLANIAVIGERERQIEIALSVQKMRAFGLSPLQIVMGLAQENMNLPAGRIERGRREYTLRMAGEYTAVADIAATQIQTSSGIVRLDQIAEVRDNFTEQRELARFNDNPTIGVDLIKQSDANTVQVGDRAKASLEKLRSQLPEGVTVEIANDDSIFIKDAVRDVFNNLVLGIIFTAFVLFLFLHSWRGTIIAALTMPISVIATFLLVQAAGFTLNMMSLMGLAVSVGILVVNAIVVLENIERLRSDGMDMKSAAAKGTAGIAVAVSAATLTNIVVFTPMAFMQGIIGPIFRQFGLTVAFATIFSLLVSLTLTPMMASRPIKKIIYVIVSIITLFSVWNFVGQMATMIISGVILLMVILDKVGAVKRFSEFWDRSYATLANDYRVGLKWAINHKFVVLASVFIMFFFGLFLFGFTGTEFMPTYDERRMKISVELPAGARLEETNNVLKRIETELAEYSEVKTVYTSLGINESGGLSGGGAQGVQYGGVKVILESREVGDYPPTSDVVKELRKKLADVPAAQIIVKEATQFGGGESGADLEILLQGTDLDALIEASDKAQEIIKSTGVLIDVRSDWQLGKPEIVVRPNRARLFDRGGTVQDVAMVLRTLFEGMVATQYREGGDEFEVKVRLQEEDRSRVDRVGDLLVPLRKGFVPLKDVATIEIGSGPTKISRKNKQRMVTVSANIGTGTVGDAQKAITEILELPTIPPSQQMKDILTGKSSVAPRPSPKLPKGVTVFFGGEAEIMAEVFSSLFQALVLAIILTYMLLAAILESYRFPFIIMMTLPLALIGVSMALVITGKTVSMIALMSIVMLVGIVVNNGILLIDFTVRLRKEGRDLHTAVLEACPIRLRPILMSTMATSLGMLPLALGFGAAGEMRSPMAVVAIGGLIVSTVLTLFVIPVLFVLFEGRGERKRLAGQ